MESSVLLKIFTIIPSLVSIVGWVIYKPAKIEMEMSALKKNLLAYIRFKISYELAHLIPEKKRNINIEDYILQSREKINDYLSSNSLVLYDYSSSQECMNSFVFCLRTFKYSALIVFFLSIVIVLIPELFDTIEFELGYYVTNTLLLVLAVLVPLVMMERKKDKLNDMFLKYEITDDKES